jgi:hypothetical protein
VESKNNFSLSAYSSQFFVFVIGGRTLHASKSKLTLKAKFASSVKQASAKVLAADRGPSLVLKNVW